MSQLSATLHRDGANLSVSHNVGDDLTVHAHADVAARNVTPAKVVDSLAIGVEKGQNKGRWTTFRTRGNGTRFEYRVNRHADAHNLSLSHKMGIKDHDVEFSVDASSNGDNVVSLETSVDNKTSVRLAHALGGSQVVTLSHQWNDTTFQPAFNVGDMKASLAVTHAVDKKNEAHVSFDQGSNLAGLRWRHTLEEGRELAVTANNINVARPDVNNIDVAAMLTYNL